MDEICGPMSRDERDALLPLDEREAQRSVALDALAEGRVMLATKLLAQAFGLPRALIELAPIPVPKVGDVMVSAWGYEQTNIDFYQVIAVTKSSVRILKIDKRRVAEASTEYDDAMMPVKVSTLTFKGAGNKLKRFRIAEDRSGYSITLSSYSSARLWHGEPCRQTGWAYGH